MPSRADGQLLVRWIEIKGGLLIETWILLSSSPCWYNRRQIHQLVWRVSWPCAWIVLDPGSQRCQSWNCSWQLLRIHKSSKEGIAKQFKQLKSMFCWRHSFFLLEGKFFIWAGCLHGLLHKHLKIYHQKQCKKQRERYKSVQNRHGLKRWNPWPPLKHPNQIHSSRCSIDHVEDREP